MNSGRGVWFEGGGGRVGERRGKGREDIVWLYKKKHEKKGKVDREKDNEIEKKTGWRKGYRCSDTEIGSEKKFKRTLKKKKM